MFPLFIKSALLALTVLLQGAFASDFQESNTRLVVIPGQNGLGGQNVRTVLPQFKQVHYVSTPEVFPDLGQSRCIKYLKETMNPLLADNNVEDIIIHASSQGTATAINYLANNPSQKVKALILEAVMGSGNSAVSHTVKNLMEPHMTLKPTKIPGSYYFLPYLAKFQMPLYSPSGMQPILNLHKLPRDLPIILIHSVADPQLSFHDAEAIYAGLRTFGNDSAYLLPVEERGHVCLLNTLKRGHLTNSLHHILKKHGLPYHEYFTKSTIDLSPYQPIAGESPYYSLRRQEIGSKLLGYGLTLYISVRILEWVQQFLYVKDNSLV